jgi:hypothetical protein
MGRPCYITTSPREAMTRVQGCCRFAVPSLLPLAALLVVGTPRLVSAQAAELGRELAAVCPAEASATDSALAVRRRASEFGLADASANLSLWREHGCVLAAEFQRSEVAHSPQTTRYALPAIDAFLRVLDRQRGDRVASVAMAALATDVMASNDPTPVLGDAFTFGADAFDAVRAGVAEPTVLKVCTDYSFAMSAVAAARYCNHRALQLGVDSTWHLVRETWFAFLDGDLPLATRSFDAAIASAHDRAARAEIIHRITPMIDSVSARHVDSVWAGLSGPDRVIWVHHQVDIGPDNGGAPFAEVLAHFEAPLTSHGKLFQLCPVPLIVNGAAHGSGQSRCFGRRDRPNTSIGIDAALLNLWDPATGQPIAVLAYGLLRAGLASEATAAGSTTRYALALYEWQCDGGGRLVDSTFEVRQSLPNELPLPRLVGNYLLVPRPHGAYTWTITVQQPGHFGVTSFDGERAPADTALQLSDLVLGAPRQHVAWVLGNDTITLAPWNSLPPHKAFQLYYQVRNDSVTSRFTTTMVLRRIVEGVIQPDPELSLSFPFDARTGINPVHREIDLSHIDGNDHQLEIELKDASGQVVARRATNLLIREP